MSSRRRRRSGRQQPKLRKKRQRINYKPVVSHVNEGKTSRWGSIYIVGSNTMDELGNPEVTELVNPTLVPELEDKNILDFVNGSGVTFVIETSHHTDGRRFWTWGCNDDGTAARSGVDSGNSPDTVRSFDGKKVVQASAGQYHGAALTSKGHVYTWGLYKDETGAFGFKPDRKENEAQYAPELMEELGQYFIIQVASTNNTTIALTDKGDMFEWGDFRFGRVSARHSQTRLLPHPVVLRKKVVAVYAGGHHNFALGIFGEVYGWGNNDHGQLGNGNQNSLTRPKKIKPIMDVIPDVEETADPPHPVKQIACGEAHTLMLTNDGRLFAWGSNSYGQLGNGTAGDSIATPQLVQFFANSDSPVVEIAAGDFHSLALTADGKVYVWGMGDGYRLGTGKDQDALEPTLINKRKFNGRDVVGIRAGCNFSTFFVAESD